jgi:predicted permease
VYAILLRPIPHVDEEGLVAVWLSAPGLELEQLDHTEVTYSLFGDRSRSFSHLAVIDGRSMNLTGDGEPVRLQTNSVSSSFFPAVRVAPILGRAFSVEDDVLGAPDVTLLSFELWRTRFGSDRDIVGRTLVLDGRPHEIVGVMPRDMILPEEDFDVLVPHRLDPSTWQQVAFTVQVLGRLTPGVALEAADAELHRILQTLPDEYEGRGGLTPAILERLQLSVFTRPMRVEIAGDVRDLLWVVLGTVGAVLLIACANVANLFLARAEGRRREVAVRSALGARRRDLMMQVLTESMVLAVAGGAAGIVVAMIGTRVFVRTGPESLPRLGEVGLHWPVLGFAAAVTVGSALLFGLIPAMRMSVPLAETLRDGGRGAGAGRREQQMRGVLVVAQVALALVLLLGSGLLLRSVIALTRIDPGFTRENVLTMRVVLPEGRYRDPVPVARFYQQVFERIAAVPGVVAVGGAQQLPMSGNREQKGTAIEDFPVGTDALPPVVAVNQMAPGYFQVMGIPLLEGRRLEWRDSYDQTASVVVSESFARQFWPEASALGKRISPGSRRGETGWYTIVGVVGDVRDVRLSEEPQPMVYVPLVSSRETQAEDDDGRGWTARAMSLAVRTQVAPTSVTSAVEQALWSVDPDLPVANTMTTEALAARSMAHLSFTAVLLGIAAGLALLLGAIGIYGVVSYVVSLRRRDIGVRMALGADEARVSRSVVRQGVAFGVLGVALGLPAALLLTRFVEALLFGVRPTDVTTVTVVAALLIGTAALASYLPARRAAAIDPIEVLRAE